MSNTFSISDSENPGYRLTPVRPAAFSASPLDSAPFERTRGLPRGIGSRAPGRLSRTPPRIRYHRAAVFNIRRSIGCCNVIVVRIVTTTGGGTGGRVGARARVCAAGVRADRGGTGIEGMARAVRLCKTRRRRLVYSAETPGELSLTPAAAADCDRDGGDDNPPPRSPW
ncbi:Hypothetical protein CINCED_3A003893 [Cinara cedri]|uniref:Uncharacterized protein n=1 Tax=Cinara cedri TaxID=506608 RepID=A0A5E4MN32_9HEMI|nr:Hypothetical protein CINCED_3A003893 [Cinara cedri]